MKLRIKSFDQLTTRELYDILQARTAIFVVEQTCPYQELDGKDFSSWHLWLEDGDGIAAYLRVLPPGAAYAEVSIGRVITVKRGTGLGRRVMEEGLRLAEEKFGPAAIRIKAQCYAREFYEKFGFRQASGEFLEDDIPHIEMVREPTGK